MAIGQQIQEAVESLVSYILVLDIVGYKVNFEIEMHMFKGRFLIGNHWRKTGSCGNFSHLVNPSFWPIWPIFLAPSSIGQYRENNE